MQMLQVSAPSRLIAVAAPAYLARHRAPVVPADLQHHSCIHLRSGNRLVPWEFEKGKHKVEVSVNGPLTVDNMELMVRVAREGIGIGYTIDAYAADHIAAGRLVALLKDWSPAHHSYYFYYAGRAQIPTPLAMLIEFFRNRRAING
jgi:DNA-binding transcriptional LysR family regulator